MTLHAVIEPLLEALPRKLPFPEVAKVYLELGTPPEKARSVIVLGVAVQQDPTFDPTAYWSLPRAEQQRDILLRMESALIAVAKSIGAPEAPIRIGAEQLRARGFPLPEFTEREMLARFGLIPGARPRGPRGPVWSSAAEPVAAPDAPRR